MFLGFASAALLLYSAINNIKKSQATLLLSCICAAAAFALIATGLNNPAKIITILSTPRKGYSGAVIMQVVMSIAGLATLSQLRRNRYVAAIIAFLGSVLSVCALSRIYMINTKPALNTYLVTAVLITLLFQCTGIVSLNTESTKRFRQSVFGASALYCIFIGAFTVRLKILSPQDRILDFASVTSGYLAPVFWGMIFCTVAVPLGYACLSLLKGRGRTASCITGAVNTIGILLLFILITQMPVIERGINNRIFFN
jgi:uncharacterized membrane protein YozB (DUF420 family)